MAVNESEALLITGYEGSLGCKALMTQLDNTFIHLWAASSPIPHSN